MEIYPIMEIYLNTVVYPSIEIYLNMEIYPNGYLS